MSSVSAPQSIMSVLILLYHANRNPQVTAAQLHAGRYGHGGLEHGDTARQKHRPTARLASMVEGALQRRTVVGRAIGLHAKIIGLVNGRGASLRRLAGQGEIVAFIGQLRIMSRSK